METRALKMKLNEGQKEEYKKRHNQVYEELETLFNEAGVSHYTIWFDAETDSLFALLMIEKPELFDAISETQICQKWWLFMSNIMETNADNSPVSIPLEKVYDFKEGNE